MNESVLMGTSIFISHSSVDADSVLQLANDLRSAGLDVWLDAWQIGVGDKIVRSIQQGLAQTSYLAVWLTRASVDSGWVEDEWQSKYDSEINERRVVVLPLLAEDCEIPFFLRGKKYADFRTSYLVGFADLIQKVALREWIDPTGANYRLILPGSYRMGTDRPPEGEPELNISDQQPAHPVTIKRPFYMAIHVVTQDEWRNLVGTEPWLEVSKVRTGSRFPAVNISWDDTHTYLQRLRDADRKSIYYLPTEEEWEYAARAGTTTEFSFGDDERDMPYYGWYKDNTLHEGYAHEVGLKRPNPWGLYDIHGNIWEWTHNWFHGPYSQKQSLQPTQKVLRGGGWDFPAIGARSAFRNMELPTRGNFVIGFRVIRRPAVDYTIGVRVSER